MSSLLLVAPLVVFALVLVLGFVGCQLPTQGTATDNYGFEVSNSGPVAWWRLSDPAGSAKAKDEIGDPPLGAHWGNYQGNVLPGQYPGLVWGGGPSASFDGGSVDVGHDDVFQSPSFTVEAFVRLLPDTLAVTRSIIESRSSTGGWALRHRPPRRTRPRGVPGRIPVRRRCIHHGKGRLQKSRDAPGRLACRDDVRRPAKRRQPLRKRCRVA